MASTIRTATEDDVSALGALLAESYALHAAALPWPFRPRPVAEAGRRVRELVPASSEDGALFVADEDGSDVGVIRLNVVDVAPRPSLAARRYVFVQELVVATSSRRQGIGRARMEPAQRWAEGQGIAEIERSVFAFSRGALAFYEALGYRSVQRRLWRRQPPA